MIGRGLGLLGEFFGGAVFPFIGECANAFGEGRDGGGVVDQGWLGGGDGDRGKEEDEFHDLFHRLSCEEVHWNFRAVSRMRKGSSLVRTSSKSAER